MHEPVLSCLANAIALPAARCAERGPALFPASSPPAGASPPSAVLTDANRSSIVSGSTLWPTIDGEPGHQLSLRDSRVKVRPGLGSFFGQGVQRSPALQSAPIISAALLVPSLLPCPPRPTSRPAPPRPPASPPTCCERCATGGASAAASACHPCNLPWAAAIPVNQPTCSSPPPNWAAAELQVVGEEGVQEVDGVSYAILPRFTQRAPIRAILTPGAG